MLVVRGTVPREKGPDMNCICGRPSGYATHAAHHRNMTPGDFQVVIFSCSPECAEAVEALRFENGVLSSARVELNMPVERGDDGY